MILKSKDTTIAYRCPYCGKCIKGIVGIFTLTGDVIKLKCDCGYSELTIEYTPDKKIRLLVPCIFCPTPHTYIIGNGIFFDREMLTLDCAYADFSICFIGSEEDIEKAIEESNRELSDLLSEGGLANYNKLHILNRSGRDIWDDDDDYISGDISVEDIVRFMLRELEADGLIHCRCNEYQLPQYDFKIVGATARIYCKTCGSRRDYPLGSSLCVNAFLHLDKIDLTAETDGETDG